MVIYSPSLEGLGEAEFLLLTLQSYENILNSSFIFLNFFVSLWRETYIIYIYMFSDLPFLP